MDTLAYRIEINNCGPFACEDTFRTLQDTILKRGPLYDQHGTTFLNYYDQRSTPPNMCRQFRGLLDQYPKGLLRFGFHSLEYFLESFGLEDDRCHDTFLRQFVNLYNSGVGMAVKVYLVKPIAKNNREVVYTVNEQELLACANTFEEFLSL